MILVSFTLIRCSAQTRLIPGELKGRNDQFIVEKLNTPFDTIKYIVVYSKRNKYNNGVPYSTVEKDPRFLPMNPKKDVHVDDNVTREIVFDVLNNKLNALHKNKEKMEITLEFETNGAIVDLSFALKANTNITLQEIENIDSKIRSKVHAVFTGKQYIYYIAINHNMPTIFF